MVGVASTSTKMCSFYINYSMSECLHDKILVKNGEIALQLRENKFYIYEI